MQFEEFKVKIVGAFSENEMFEMLTEDRIQKLFEFTELLLETNKTTNLTAITDIDSVILKHLVDSAAISPLISQAESVIDIGCGPGFPSIPLAILRDDLSITALDSTGKKIDFVNAVAHALGLNNIQAICGRAEDFVEAHRESFDCSVSRAVARLNVLAEISLPLVKVGGRFIAMKSSRGEEELTEAKKGIQTLGADLNSVSKRKLSNRTETIERETYVFVKTSPTPKQFPRKYSQILKKPL